MPRTLLWRTFLAVALVIVLSVVAWFQIFRAYEREPRAHQIARNVVSVVNLTRTALLTARPELRRDLLIDLAENEGVRVYPVDPGERIVPMDESAPGVRLVAEEIRRSLGPETRLATERDGVPGYWVSFRIDDQDEYWAMLPRDRFAQQVALQWLGWGAAALGLALAAAAFIVFRVRRPLWRLTNAAAEIGRGRIPAPLDESGPLEIATLSHAFNQMTRDLARLEDDRALILAGVSHDLRTPLARLRLGIEMVDADTELRAGMAADIEEMDRIIGQFLDFARAEGGEPAEPTDLAALAREVGKHYRDVGHSLAEEIEAVPEVPVRRLAVRRVIANLLDNAFRYGETDVRLCVRAADRGVAIEVLDRGPGIPPAEVERLKQPFTRLDSSRTGKSGSGLGLAIVDRIAKLHGAQFDLLPRQGGGLVARLTFPRAG